MNRRLSLAAIAAATAAVFAGRSGPAAAREQNPFVVQKSPYSAAQTLDRLATAVEGAGATIFARIDHAKGAASIGADLAPTQVLIFGNPAIGTEPIQAARSAGLDLPLRVLAYEENGETFLLYRDPAAFAFEHGLPEDHPKIQMMGGALGKLTAAAIAV